LLPTSSPKRFIANERDEIRNETKLFLGNAPTFIFLLSFTIPLRKERAERERERERERQREREERYSAQNRDRESVIIAQTHSTRREVRSTQARVLYYYHHRRSSRFFLSLSLSLYPEELSRGHQRYKKRSLSLFLLAQTVSLNHFSIYHTYIVKIIAIIAISRARGLSRPVFSAPEKRAIRARNLYFFVSLSLTFGHFWLRKII